jgi:hypothetical protein
VPQLDIILWFSQVFWVTFFFVIFFSYARILHIPLSYLMEGVQHLKKKMHYNVGFALNLHHYLNLQKFYVAFSQRKI